MSTVYLNGKFMALDDAKISPMDRGFTFGDGVYEVIPVYNRRIFRLSDHIDRLQESMKRIYISSPYSMDEWQNILESLVEYNNGLNQSIYLQVTRGVTPREHTFSHETTPTVFIMSRPLEKPDNSKGSAAITRQDIRWKLCNIKAITLLPSVLLRYDARLEGANEAILISHGYVTEGAASNIFICKDRHVSTPPKSEKILAGITRDLVINLLRDNNISCLEEMVTLDMLRTADEIWLTSSTQEIVPVVKLDGVDVGNGVPGTLYEAANKIYQEFLVNY